MEVVEAFLDCAQHVLSNGARKSDMAEVQDLICQIQLDRSDLEEFWKFVERISEHPELKRGWEKAQRAYIRRNGGITKPSYIGRLKEYPFLKKEQNDWDPIDQFSIISEQFMQAPQSSNLGMIVFHPYDIRDAFRPGYVPCLSFIDIKFRNGVLSSKFYFRSCDFAEVALFDFYHCLKIHDEIARSFQDVRPDVTIVEHTALFNFSRAFTYNRRRLPLAVIFEACGMNFAAP